MFFKKWHCDIVIAFFSFWTKNSTTSLYWYITPQISQDCFLHYLFADSVASVIIFNQFISKHFNNTNSEQSWLSSNNKKADIAYIPCESKRSRNFYAFFLLYSSRFLLVVISLYIINHLKILRNCILTDKRGVLFGKCLWVSKICCHCIFYLILSSTSRKKNDDMSLWNFMYMFIYTVKYPIFKNCDVSRNRLHLCGNITDWKAQWCFGLFWLVMRMRGTPMQKPSSISCFYAVAAAVSCSNNSFFLVFYHLFPTIPYAILCFSIFHLLFNLSIIRSILYHFFFLSFHMLFFLSSFFYLLLCYSLLLLFFSFSITFSYDR